MKLVFNPHKKLHKDMYSQIDVLSDLFNKKRYGYKDDLRKFEETNLSVNGKGLYDPNIDTLKKIISDFEYAIEKLTELKTQIPIK
jgi:hypothetical protein